MLTYLNMLDCLWLYPLYTHYLMPKLPTQLLIPVHLALVASIGMARTAVFTSLDKSFLSQFTLPWPLVLTACPERPVNNCRPTQCRSAGGVVNFRGVKEDINTLLAGRKYITNTPLP